MNVDPIRPTYQIQFLESLPESLYLFGIEVGGHLHGETRLVPHLGGLAGRGRGREGAFAQERRSDTGMLL